MQLPNNDDLARALARYHCVNITGNIVFKLEFDICDFSNRQAIEVAGIVHYKGVDFFDYHRYLNLDMGKTLNLPALASFAILGECVNLGISLAAAHGVMAGLVRSVTIECGLIAESWKMFDAETASRFMSDFECLSGTGKLDLVTSVLGITGRHVQRFLFLGKDGIVQTASDADSVFSSKAHASLKVIDAHAVARRIMEKRRCAFFELRAL